MVLEMVWGFTKIYFYYMINKLYIHKPNEWIKFQIFIEAPKLFFGTPKNQFIGRARSFF